MAEPTAKDPLGRRLDPADAGDMFNALIDKRIEMRVTGRTSNQFNAVGDWALVQELLARGWAVFRPTGQNDAS